MTSKYYGIASNEAEFAAVRQYLKNDQKLIKWFSNEKLLREALDGQNSAIVFISSSPSYDAYELCGELSLFYPLVMVILLLPVDEIDYKKAMYVGAVDIISSSADENEISQAIYKAESIIELKSEKLIVGDPASKKESRVITVAGMKGGIGKTMLSANLACVFSKENLNVAAVDLDLKFGDLSILFDIQPKKTIYEWMKESYENGEGTVKGYLALHPSGVELFGAPKTLELAKEITKEHIVFMIAELKKDYDVIIIDTSAAFSEENLAVFEESDHILLITTPELPSLKHTKITVDTLKDLGFIEKFKVILNKDTKIKQITLESVENIIGTNVAASIPADEKAVVSSINKGIPFILSDSRAPAGKAIFQLVDQLYLRKKEKSKKRKLFSFSKKKKRRE